jgi:hypothetical protein
MSGMIYTRYGQSPGFASTDDLHQIPIGPWPADPRLREIGLYQLEHALLSIESFTLGMLGRALSWSAEECQVIGAEVRREMRDPTNHLFTTLHFITGRRPED